MTDIQPRDDYDSPWKDAIEEMLADFMAFYFPAAHRLIDWRQRPIFLDKELRRLVPEAVTGRRVVDKLVEVTLRSGRRERIYIHIEIQGSRDPCFEERMYTYHYKIFDRYRRPVASFAVLTDDNPGWRPSHYARTTLGNHTRQDFSVAKLLDYQSRQSELLAGDNPFGLITVAHLLTRRTRRRPEQRYRAKYQLLRLLYGRSWNKDRIIQLLRVIDWLMALPPALEHSLRQDLATLEGVEPMQYITSFERLAKQEGRQEGMQQGIRALLTRQLNRRFGPLPPPAEERLAEASTSELDTWADRVLDARSLDEVFRQNGEHLA